MQIEISWFPAWHQTRALPLANDISRGLYFNVLSSESTFRDESLVNVCSDLALELSWMWEIYMILFHAMNKM